MGKHTHRCHNIRKRCDCPWRQWAKCAHPWHFFLKWQGHEYRFQINQAAGKPPGYAMPKTEAESWRDQFCSQIRAGTFRHANLGPAPSTPEAGLSDQRLTLNDVITHYKTRHVWAPGRRKRGGQIMVWNLGTAQRVEVPAANGRMIALGQKVLAEITKADLDAARGPLVAWKPGSKGGEVGANRILRRLRHLFNWAIAEGYVDQTPFKRHGMPVIRMNGSAESPRHRRLQGDEEERLLRNATPWLRDLIIAALETGCRRGELLSLQWQQVRWTENCLVLPGDKTKTGEARAVPITGRLHLVLERRQRASDGEAFPAEAYVFGNEIGEQRRWIQDAWEATREASATANLHFHDLRREFASRLLETPGVSLHDVADWLGHTNVMTTSRYLATSAVRKQKVLERFEAFTAVRSEDAKKTVAVGEVSDSAMTDLSRAS